MLDQVPQTQDSLRVRARPQPDSSYPHFFSTMMHPFAYAYQHGLVVVIAFLLFMIFSAPYLVPQDFDYDEGINLMKSVLLNERYTLYSQIWSDQPPILTALLAGWMSLFGQSIAIVRWLIIILSAGLLWALFQAVRQTTSATAATVAALLLLLTDYYLRLSGSVMVGLPSLTFTLFSVALLITGQREGWRIVGSAILMGIALQTKLMVGLSIPGILLFLWLDGSRSLQQNSLYRLQRLKKTGIWLLIMGVTFLEIGFNFGSLRIDLLLEPHLGLATRNHAPFIAASTSFMPNFLNQHLLLLLLALVGLWWALRHRINEAVIPIAWLATGLIAFTFHRPIWYHHVLYLTIPLVWLCAYGVEPWIRALYKTALYKTAVDQTAVDQTTMAQSTVSRVIQMSGLLLLGGLVAAAVFLYPKPLTGRVAEQMTFSRPYMTPAVVEQLRADTANLAPDDPAWLFTDRPFYAFMAGRAVPPELAVFSRKRIATGFLTPQTMVEILQSYQPEAILLERFTYDLGPEVMGVIDQEYELILDLPPARYYRRISRRVSSAAPILPPPMPPLGDRHPLPILLP